MASPEFQPSAPRRPEFRPGPPAVSAPETAGRPIEATPTPANPVLSPSPSPAVGSIDNSRTPAASQPAKRSTFSLGRSTVKLPERADATRAVLVDEAIQVVTKNEDDPALQKDELIPIMEAYRGLEGPGESP